jgi:hypothetical protein
MLVISSEGVLSPGGTGTRYVCVGTNLDPQHLFGRVESGQDGLLCLIASGPTRDRFDLVGGEVPAEWRECVLADPDGENDVVHFETRVPTTTTTVRKILFFMDLAFLKAGATFRTRPTTWPGI